MISERNSTGSLFGLGENTDKLIVQKCHPLVDLCFSDLDLVELKLLDLYLARIDSRNPYKRTVVLRKGEIERVFGVSRMRSEDLAKHLKKLGTGIKVPDKTSEEGFRIMWLFDEATCKIDEAGQWEVTLEASTKSLQWFFNIEDLGYFRYTLRNAAVLVSRYSYALFLYVEENRYRKSWIADLSYLREYFQCSDDASYDQFKVFNDRVLKRATNEINTKTECHFSYAPIKSGRKVVSIRFSVSPLTVS